MKKDKKRKCPLCEEGKRVRSDPEWFWSEEFENGYLPAVRCLMCVDAGQNLNIEHQFINVKIDEKDLRILEEITSSFKIQYCPICGRKIEWRDKTLIK